MQLSNGGRSIKSSFSGFNVWLVNTKFTKLCFSVIVELLKVWCAFAAICIRSITLKLFSATKSLN
ncbi:hypothetical protein [Rickettsia asiatica]|uniref:hypothetical protein n=1 Tax=Rickettsia asiatica TaxID=238800 RepID=UPI001E506CBD|nr:hypothetical protein [Rickettsia asiatica]